jgi:hypothetical protein
MTVGAAYIYGSMVSVDPSPTHPLKVDPGSGSHGAWELR